MVRFASAPSVPPTPRLQKTVTLRAPLVWILALVTFLFYPLPLQGQSLSTGDKDTARSHISHLPPQVPSFQGLSQGSTAAFCRPPRGKRFRYFGPQCSYLKNGANTALTLHHSSFGTHSWICKGVQRPSNKELQRNAVFPLPKGAIEVKRNYWPQSCQHLMVWPLFCFFCLFIFVVETLECICEFCPQFYGVWSWWLIIFVLWLWPKIPSANGHRATVPRTNWKQTNKTQKLSTSTCLFVYLFTWWSLLSTPEPGGTPISLPGQNLRNVCLQTVSISLLFTAK